MSAFVSVYENAYRSEYGVGELEDDARTAVCKGKGVPLVTEDGRRLVIISQKRK